MLMEHFNSILFRKSRPANKQHTYQSLMTFVFSLHLFLLLVRSSGGFYSEGSRAVIFTVCSDIFILYWPTKTSVRVEMYQLNFPMIF
jgi:hypothetical protein